MRFFTARRLALTSAILAAFSLAIIPGCSKQGEGERCGSDSVSVTVDDNADCADGLTCTVLGTAEKPDNRCCYAGRASPGSPCDKQGEEVASAGSPANSSAGMSSGGASGTAAVGGSDDADNAGASGSADMSIGGTSGSADMSTGGTSGSADMSIGGASGGADTAGASADTDAGG